MFNKTHIQNLEFVNYHQQLSFNGPFSATSFQVEAQPNGISLGSAIWTIKLKNTFKITIGQCLSFSERVNE